MYTLKSELYYHHKRKKDIVIEKTGNCIDTRSEKEIKNGEQFSNNKEQTVMGNCKLNYQMYDNSGFIDTITGRVDLKFSEKHSEVVSFEIFTIENKQPKTSEEKQQIQDEELKEEIKEKKVIYIR